MATTIDMEDVCKRMSLAVVNELTKAAEPFIKDVLSEIETQLRKRVGEMVVNTINSNYEMERLGTNLIIKVKLNG